MFTVCSGVGLAIAHRLLSSVGANESTQSLQWNIMLACRNQKKAANAREELLREHPEAVIDIVPLDTSSIESVQEAADSILGRYSRLDVLFCNAGAMLIDSLSIPGCIKGLLIHPIEFFASSEALNQVVGAKSRDGLGQTFATNVFGHYYLVIPIKLYLNRSIHNVYISQYAHCYHFHPRSKRWSRVL